MAGGLPHAFTGSTAYWIFNKDFNIHVLVFNIYRYVHIKLFVRKSFKLEYTFDTTDGKE